MVATPEGRAEGVIPVDRILRTIVVGFRLLGWLWMALLVVATLATDRFRTESALNEPVTIATFALATAWTVVTVVVARKPEVLGGTTFAVLDGVVALLVASGPYLAMSESSFTGGYQISWIAVAAYHGGLRWALGSAVILSAHQWIALETDDTRGVIQQIGAVVFFVYAVIVGWTFDIIRERDRWRREAEARLAVEHARRVRQEERAELGNRLHDSVLQTFHAIRLASSDEARVTYLVRRQERELRRLIHDLNSKMENSFQTAVLVMRDDVEEVYGLEVDVVFQGDAEMDGSLEGLVEAAREALVNVAKHAEVGRCDLFAEVGGRNAAIFVRDRGKGFDPEMTARGHGLEHSVGERMKTLGGSVELVSAPGEGTEVVLRIGEIQ